MGIVVNIGIKKTHRIEIHNTSVLKLCGKHITTSREEALDPQTEQDGQQQVRTEEQLEQEGQQDGQQQVTIEVVCWGTRWATTGKKRGTRWVATGSNRGGLLEQVV